MSRQRPSKGTKRKSTFDHNTVVHTESAYTLFSMASGWPESVKLGYLCDALQKGDKLLLEYWVKLFGEEYYYECKDSAGNPLLLLACKAGNLDMVGLLVTDKKVKPYKSSNFIGETPLSVAVEGLDASMVWTLLGRMKPRHISSQCVFGDGYKGSPQDWICHRLLTGKLSSEEIEGFASLYLTLQIEVNDAKIPDLDGCHLGRTNGLSKVMIARQRNMKQTQYRDDKTDSQWFRIYALLSVHLSMLPDISLELAYDELTLMIRLTEMFETEKRFHFCPSDLTEMNESGLLGGFFPEGTMVDEAMQGEYLTALQSKLIDDFQRALINYGACLQRHRDIKESDSVTHGVCDVYAHRPLKEAIGLELS